MSIFNIHGAWPGQAMRDRLAQYRLQRQLQLQLAASLRRPVPEARSLLAANKRFLARVERRRNHHQPTFLLRRHLQRFRCRQLAGFRRLGKADPRSRIIAAFHFGDFVYGMNYLLRQDFRISYVQTLETSTVAYFDNMQRLFGDRLAGAGRQLPVSGHSPAKLSACLKQQACNLVMFADLPPGFGATALVDCLGREARFPRGIASLAVRNCVPVLPVICVSSQGYHDILIGSQIEPQSMAPSANAAIVGITQTLTAFFSSYLWQHPAQWRYLRVLPFYFMAAQQDKAASQSLEPAP